MSAHPLPLPPSLPHPFSSRHVRLRDDGTPLVEFAELHAAIHLAHKYQCPEVEKRALFVLKKYYTSHFPEYNAYDASATALAVPPPSAAIAAINHSRDPRGAERYTDRPRPTTTIDR